MTNLLTLQNNQDMQMTSFFQDIPVIVIVTDYTITQKLLSFPQFMKDSDLHRLSA